MIHTNDNQHTNHDNNDNDNNNTRVLSPTDT